MRASPKLWIRSASSATLPVERRGGLGRAVDAVDAVGEQRRDPVLVAVRGPLILMCAQGYQSSLAASTLHDLGVVNATDMDGGFERWRAEGLPIVGAPGQTRADE